jgi:hypothetical protein
MNFMKATHLHNVGFCVFLLSAVSAQAETIAGTGIFAFPCTITNSGLYHLTSNNAQFNRTNGAAILIQLSEAQKDRDVVLDLNDHTIAQTNRHYSPNGSANTRPTGIKIVTTGKGRVTIRNGTLAGFAVGIEIYGGDQFLVENMTIVSPSCFGILVSGACKNGTIRNNRVIGSTDCVAGSYGQWGIYTANRSGMRILNNDVCDLTTAHAASPAVGIQASGENVVIDDNRVHNTRPLEGGLSCGIRCGGNGVTVVNSRISTVDYGLAFWEGGGHYRDNVVDDSLTPYSGGTDAGNNH